MKILISGPDYYKIREMIVKSFRNKGCDVEISEWPNQKGSLLYNSKLLFYEKFNLSTPKELEDFRYSYFKEAVISYNNSLIKHIAVCKPDIVIVLRGDILFPETLHDIKERYTLNLVLWTYDSALRFPKTLLGINYYDLVYTFEPTDIPILKEKFHLDAKFLPMAFSPDFFFPIPGEQFDRDLCFIGVLKSYPSRKNLLEFIIKRRPNLKIDIWGNEWTWYNPFLQYEYKIKRRSLGKHIHNYNIAPAIVNKIYNSSRICLNIHHPQSKEGLNPRTFEIMGSGGFQLVDCKKTLDDIFDGMNEIVYYQNEIDLLDKIDYYLEHEDERLKIAKKGMNAVKQNHTYNHRAETILSDVKKLKCN